MLVVLAVASARITVAEHHDKSILQPYGTTSQCPERMLRTNSPAPGKNKPAKYALVKILLLVACPSPVSCLSKWRSAASLNLLRLTRAAAARSAQWDLFSSITTDPEDADRAEYRPGLVLRSLCSRTALCFLDVPPRTHRASPGDIVLHQSHVRAQLTPAALRVQ